MPAATAIGGGTTIDIVQKLGEVVVHGANTSFLVDLPYSTHPQDAKQDAKTEYLLHKNIAKRVCCPRTSARLMVYYFLIMASCFPKQRGNMWVHADYSQVTGEVKERNRFMKALNEIREIALSNCDEEISSELKEQFKLIAQTCDDVLKPVTRTNK